MARHLTCCQTIEFKIGRNSPRLEFPFSLGFSLGKFSGVSGRTERYGLIDILRRAGIKPLKGKTGPRIHDLRHSMVVNRILEWYRAGINPQDKLPFLATYLGHRDIHSTLVYITVTQDLLHQANERFRAFRAHCLHVTEGATP